MNRAYSGRVVLRAEIHQDGGVLVTRTIRVTASTVTLAGPVSMGEEEEIRIVLSFPRFIEPFEVRARLRERRTEAEGEVVVCDIARASSHAEKMLRLIDALIGEGAEAGNGDEEASALRCLLVEDNGFMRDLFEYAMEKYATRRRKGISLKHAPSAEAAWDMLGEGRYDVAIVDHYLPLQTGAQLIQRIRGDRRLDGLTVVAISVGGDEVKAAAISAGADLFLNKPIVMRDIFATLDRLAPNEESA